jgi:WD40 repeat protein
MKKAQIPIVFMAFLFWTVAWWFNPGPVAAVSFSVEAAGASLPSRDLRTVINAGHTSTVSSIDWSRDGKYLISGSWDGTIRLWEAKGGRLIKVMAEETRRVEDVAFSPDGTYVASVHAVPQEGKSETKIIVRLWDVKRGSVWKSFQASAAPPPIYEWHHFLAWSPDSKSLAFMSEVNKVCVREISSGEVKLTAGGEPGRITAVVWSQDSQFIAAGGEDGTVRLYNAGTGDKGLTLKIPSLGVIHSLAWSPNGAFLAAAGKDLAVWEVPSGRLVQVLGKAKGWHQVVWSPDGRFLTGNRNDGEVHLWEPRSGSLSAVLKGPRFGSMGMAWSPDSKNIVTCGGDIRIWEAGSGRVATIIKNYQPSTRQVDWSPDGRLIMVAGIGEMLVWEAQSGNLLKHFDNLLSYVGHITWNPDKKVVAWSSGYEEKKGTWIWETDSKKLRKFQAIGPVWSPDGQKFAAGTGGGWEIGPIKIWDAKKGNPLHTLEKSKDILGSYSWSPDGRFIAATCSGKTIRLGGECWQAVQNPHRPRGTNLFAGFKPRRWILGHRQRRRSGADLGDRKFLPDSGHERALFPLTPLQPQR